MKETLLPQLKKACRDVRLRPDIVIGDLCDFADGTGQFFSINFYWDESYLDIISYTKDKQINLLMLKVEQIGKELPGVTHTEWGSSDGHLFLYLHIHTSDLIIHPQPCMR